VKIKEIRAFEIDLTPRPKTKPRQPSRAGQIKMSRPIHRYPELSEAASAPKWKRAAVIVTAEDGTTGFGVTINSGPVMSVVNDHFAHALVGQNCMATEKLWDMMVRMALPYGTSGLTSYAISALDVALWDLKGKVLQRPVYELLGGPQKEKIFCYATGFDTEWYLELGFKATKIFAPYGPQDGIEGLNKNVELVARTRETVGDNVELMLDCWMSSDEEYTVRLAEACRPYRLKWIEEFVPPEAYEACQAVRTRIPWQTLA